VAIAVNSDATTDGVTTPDDASTPPAPYRLYVLILLAVTYTLNTADRGILNIVLPPIKKEFGLADWQLGMLAGPLFAIIYAVCSIPFASLSDRANRKTLIASTMIVFSAATALCGVATSYVHLMIGRFVTGSAESATVPAASSIIADLYGSGRRVWAIAIFSAGGSFGTTVAGLVGGVVAYHFGWRAAFMAMGIPGLLLGVVMLLTVREPARLATSRRPAGQVALPLASVVKRVFSQPAFRWLCFGNLLLFFHNSGANAFQSLFMVQTHGLNLQQIGTVGTALGIGGLIVTLGVGRVADRLALRDIRWLMYIPLIVALLGIPCALIQQLATNGWVALVVGGSGALFVLAYAAPLYAAVQALVPGTMRARAIAFMLLLTNLIGVGFGPPTAGLLSDVFGSMFGAIDGLRYALIVMLIPNLIAAFAFWRASRTLKADIARSAMLEQA
jgi:MFS family permease